MFEEPPVNCYMILHCYYYKKLGLYHCVYSIQARGFPASTSLRGSSHNTKCLDRKLYSRIERRIVRQGRLLTKTNHTSCFIQQNEGLNNISKKNFPHFSYLSIIYCIVLSCQTNIYGCFRWDRLSNLHPSRTCTCELRPLVGRKQLDQ